MQTLAPNEVTFEVYQENGLTVCMIRSDDTAYEVGFAVAPGFVCTDCLVYDRYKFVVGHESRYGQKSITKTITELGCLTGMDGANRIPV
ncbi:hypothetical protein FDG94_gp112 [Pseudomonas phage SM1]|uniref:Uncharacterized protein n=2 Tax=Samunavirus TaxID=2560221 RepID=A0A0U3E4S9_9CAUD|nr:hypothetical protein FDG94_gp112 [Pseudomonas phage SM1]UGC97051.1 hypothetical protein [Pseudomonas phage BHU-1]UGV19995.1 hypothetical protein [Pseudomonas phage Pa BHU-15]UIW13571.1 hypothetical protein [Pseudomonas phage Pa BHU-17]UVN14025.1 hypothetical protein FBPa45_0023 [Pseudomonas phage vB_PaeS_FBPa45]WDS62459.1 hypothetical protein UFRH6_29 [Pseudomonas phage UF_RH6]